MTPAPRPTDGEGSALAALLRRRIAVEGPITLATFMAEALGHPVHGYYRTRDPLGATGDFVTAPEISQMFGELIGLWCADLWQRMGEPAEISLVELGPGRGTLMADALRAMAVLPALRRAVRVHLVETSPVLRARQARTLAGAAEPAWHDDPTTLPAGPALVIANEFFDALPIRQFERTGSGWAERRVGLDPDDPDRLHLMLAPTISDKDGPALVPPHLRGVPPGSIVEVCPAGRSIMAGLAARVAGDGGAVLAIDYGHDGSRPGDTLQAVRSHRPVPVLETPGEADLTAHVDFGSLARTAVEQGAAAWGPVDQGRFLLALGIRARAERLCRNQDEAGRAAIEAALKRLVDPAEMGRLFQVLAVADPALGPPAGFPSL